jgi:aspartate aminotransferase
MSFFESVSLQPNDPVMGLNLLFAKEKNPLKVNLGVGTYKDENGQSIVMRCIREAEALVYEKNQAKDYLPIVGDTEFIKNLLPYVLGEDCEALLDGRVQAIQSLGGSGALRIGTDFLTKLDKRHEVYVPDPTWANHFPLMNEAGLQIHSYPYYDSVNHCLDFSRMKEHIQKIPKGNIILLHACCHSPTGIDPSFEQWCELADIIKEQKLIPFFDFAYHAFGDGIEGDRRAIRHFIDSGHECLIAYTCSKNFGLYGERVGALIICSSSPENSLKILSNCKQIARRSYSVPPCGGARLVKTVLSSESLTLEWKKELNEIRERVKQLRQNLCNKLAHEIPGRDFSFMRQQKGMFSFAGLSSDEALKLRKKNAIYLLENGRINVAGLNASNVDYVVASIKNLH